MRKEECSPAAGFSHAAASKGCRGEERGWRREHGAGAALPPHRYPCPAPLMMLLRSWAAAAADAAIVSLTIIQILDLLVTETFFFLSSYHSISHFGTPGTGLGTALQRAWCRGAEPLTPGTAADTRVNAERLEITWGSSSAAHCLCLSITAIPSAFR